VKKRKITKDGKAWRHVAEAVHKNDFSLLQAINAYKKAQNKLELFLTDLKLNEDTRINHLG
jgi:hypothetical protein